MHDLSSGKEWNSERKREAAFRAPMGKELFRPDSRIIERPGWYQVETPSAVGFLNEVYLSQVEAADAERIIDEVVETHRAAGKTVKWCVGHWTQPTDFRERLLRRSFEARPVRTMSFDTNRSIDVTTGITGIEIGLADLDTYLAVATAGWDIPRDQMASELRSHRAAFEAVPRTAHFFAAVLDGAMIGTCGLFLREGYGYLVGSQVNASMRGRGVYRALVEARLAFLRARGISLAITHARDATSAPMLAHLGFETVYRYECLYFTPP